FRADHDEAPRLHRLDTPPTDGYRKIGDRRGVEGTRVTLPRFAARLGRDRFDLPARQGGRRPCPARFGRSYRKNRTNNGRLTASPSPPTAQYPPPRVLRPRRNPETGRKGSAGARTLRVPNRLFFHIIGGPGAGAITPRSERETFDGPFAHAQGDRCLAGRE